MCPIQNRSKSNSSSDVDSDAFCFEEADGWNADVSFDHYVKNKIGNEKKRIKFGTNLIALANRRVRLASVIFSHSIQFQIQPYITTGWTHKARCPFPDHRDSSPSFGYNSKDDKFLCFGCNRSGYAVEFLANISGRTRLEVAKAILAASGSTEDTIEELEAVDDDALIIDELLLGLAAYVREFLAKHKTNENSIKYSEDVLWWVDLYLNKKAMTGTLSVEIMEARIAKAKEKLDLFGPEEEE